MMQIIFGKKSWVQSACTQGCKTHPQMGIERKLKDKSCNGKNVTSRINVILWLIWNVSKILSSIKQSHLWKIIVQITWYAKNRLGKKFLKISIEIFVYGSWSIF